MQDESPQSDWARLRVLSETKWYRVYETDAGIPVTVSKFLTDKIELTESALRDQWPAWTPGEKVLFAQAFAQKSSFTSEDQPILDFLIAANDPAFLQAVIAPALPRHPDRNRSVTVLLGQLESSSHPQTNAIMALLEIVAKGGSNQPKISAALKKLHHRLATLMQGDTPVTTSETSQSKTDIALAIDFVTCCAALAFLEKSPAYLDQIRSFTSHPNRAVASVATRHLANLERQLKP